MNLEKVIETCIICNRRLHITSWPKHRKAKYHLDNLEHFKKTNSNDIIKRFQREMFEKFDAYCIKTHGGIMNCIRGESINFITPVTFHDYPCG